MGAYPEVGACPGNYGTCSTSVGVYVTRERMYYLYTKKRGEKIDFAENKFF